MTRLGLLSSNQTQNFYVTTVIQQTSVSQTFQSLALQLLEGNLQKLRFILRNTLP